MTDFQQCVLLWLFVSSVYYTYSLDVDMKWWKRLGCAAIAPAVFIVWSIAMIGAGIYEMVKERKHKHKESPYK